MVRVRYLLDGNQSLLSEYPASQLGHILLVFGGLLGPSKAPMLIVPLCLELPAGTLCCDPFGTGNPALPFVKPVVEGLALKSVECR